MMDPIVILSLLTPRLDTFILAPKMHNVESLAKYGNTFQDIVLTTFVWDTGTHRLTNSPKTLSLQQLHWQRHQKPITTEHVITASQF